MLIHKADCVLFIKTSHVPKHNYEGII